MEHRITEKLDQLSNNASLIRNLEFLKDTGVIDAFTDMEKDYKYQKEQGCMDMDTQIVFRYCVSIDNYRISCMIGEVTESDFSEVIVAPHILDDDCPKNGELNAVLCRFDKLDVAIKNVFSIIK